MIVPFWSWNLSDTTHVRSHTKFQLIWAINTAITRGGAQCAPPLSQMWSWDPLSIRVKTLLRHYAKRALTPRSLNVKLGPRHKSQKGRAGWLA